MKFYQSGISSDRDAAILKNAGVEHVLVDQFDFACCYGKFAHVALDSGAYRAWKRQLWLDPVEYADAVADLAPEFDFVVSLDVIGDPEASWRNWEYLRGQGLETVPVWHYGSPRCYLDVYLSNSTVVGIGALASILRDKENPARTHVLADLVGLATQYPGRFHLFGLNWVKAINQLAPLVHSADSSLWLRGARYGISVFRNTRSQKLAQAPAYILEDWAEKHGRTWASGRTGLLGSNAGAIDKYCNTETGGAKP